MEKTYEEIKYQDKIIAILLRAEYRAPGIQFFSPADFSQQLGYLPHPKDHVIPAHFHKKVQREISLTQEVLFIRKGKVEVNFYTNEKEYISSRVLNQGDIVFLCSGGHGFKILEDADMIEVKQGPYSGKDGDKVIFEGVENDPGK